MNSDLDTVYVGSFDIGKKNFAFLVEKFNKRELEQIQDVDKEEKYAVDGTPLPQLENILNRVYLNGTIIETINADITKDCKKGSYLDPTTFYNLTEHLDQYKHLWDKCAYIIIEQQMSFGRKYNTMALKLAQHCFSYFSIKYGKDLQIVEFPAYHKTQVLGAEKICNQTKAGKITYKAISKTDRKKWSVVVAKNILTIRNDTDSLSYMSNAKKRDDLADVLTQLQAWKYLNFISKSI